MPEVRRTARALLTDPDGHVLLLRVHDDVALDASDPVQDYWIMVGGGVEPGETFEAAVVREIFEETGHHVDDPGSVIWRRRKSLTDRDGVVRSSEEYYFWCRLGSTDLSTAYLTDAERWTIREFRWWALDDPELAQARIFPEGFVAAAKDVVANGRPSIPRWIAGRPQIPGQ